jgi:putative Mg2+ transporter-C (MgtC) family protein
MTGASRTNPPLSAFEASGGKEKVFSCPGRAEHQGDPWQSFRRFAVYGHRGLPSARTGLSTIASGAFHFFGLFSANSEDPMTLTLTWTDVMIRILLTVAAGAAIGFERGEHGQAAGLRTTILVGLAACLAMLQANWLMNTVGKASDSFIVLDLMRLPMGILSGVGFIGAGAILKRNDLVLGVTTAATLWFVTVVGLCFGGGQIDLGLVGTALGIVVLPGLKILEKHIKQERAVELFVQWDGKTIDEDAIRAAISQAGLRISRTSAKYGGVGNARELRYVLAQRSYLTDHEVPSALRDLACKGGIMRLEWTG